MAAKSLELQKGRIFRYNKDIFQCCIEQNRSLIPVIGPFFQFGKNFPTTTGIVKKKMQHCYFHIFFIPYIHPFPYMYHHTCLLFSLKMNKYNLNSVSTRITLTNSWSNKRYGISNTKFSTKLSDTWSNQYMAKHASRLNLIVGQNLILPLLQWSKPDID